MRLRAFPLFVVILFVAVVAGAGSARAQGDPTADPEWPNHLYDKYQLSAATSLVILNTNLRVDALDGDVGTDIDLEDDLGLDVTAPEPRFTLRFRPGKRHEIEVGYLFARRNGTKEILRDIEIADTSFTAGARVRTTFDSDNLFVTYRYAFMAKENTQVGAALGLGAYFLEIKLEALAGIGSGGNADSVEYNSDTNFLGPTATLGVYGRFRFDPKWYLETDARILSVKVDRLHGRVLNFNVAGRYYPWRTIGFEAGYGAEFVRLDVDKKEPGDSGLIDLQASARFKFSTQNVRLGIIKTF